MDKEGIEIVIKADSGSTIGDHFEDERRFTVSVPSRADVSKLFDEFQQMINAREGWDQ